jgi:hypothetical protein
MDGTLPPNLTDLTIYRSAYFDEALRVDGKELPFVLNTHMPVQPWAGLQGVEFSDDGETLSFAGDVLSSMLDWEGSQCLPEGPSGVNGSDQLLSQYGDCEPFFGPMDEAALQFSDIAPDNHFDTVTQL